MTATRRLLLAALLCGAALTACTSSKDAPATAAPATATPRAVPPPVTAPTASTAPSVSSSSPATPTPACASAAYLPGHRIVQLTTVSATSLTARPTRFVCGPDVPGDGHYEADGTPAPYALTPIATATLVDLEHGEGATVVPLTVLVQHADDCLAKREPTRPYGCYGDKYDLVSDSQGRITRISELYQP
ncbi:hypothetical protein OH807_28540 [Kitasatospora sp. NBC_01560]|uniref:hypothetical protein n=1 Tax=Kitasatospora sp. NBC_01560 TaxID=2975965 RepID=UPI00386D8531